MSKSDPHPGSCILLTDSPEEITMKLKKSVTDSVEGVSFDPKNRPGVSNLVQIYGHMQRRSDFGAIAEELKGCSMRQLKERVAECVIEGLKPVREQYARVMAEGEGYLEEIAEEGARKARESAEETMVQVRRAIGLR
jgi:tryptophanyl-tRNA synthetase